MTWSHTEILTAFPGSEQQQAVHRVHLGADG